MMCILCHNLLPFANIIFGNSIIINHGYKKQFHVYPLVFFVVMEVLALLKFVMKVITIVKHHKLNISRYNNENCAKFIIA